MEDINRLYEYIKDEFESVDLQGIKDKDMYIRLAEILNGLRGKGYEGIDENVRCALVEILNNLVRLMLSIRMEKVRSNTTTVDHSMLTEEELYIAMEERRFRAKYDLVLSSIINGRSKLLEHIRASVRNTLVVVRFLKDTDRFLGNDGHVYGPFKSEDVASIPLKDALELTKDGTVVELPALDI